MEQKFDFLNNQILALQADNTILIQKLLDLNSISQVKDVILPGIGVK